MQGNCYLKKYNIFTQNLMLPSLLTSTCHRFGNLWKIASLNLVISTEISSKNLKPVFQMEGTILQVVFLRSANNDPRQSFVCKPKQSKRTIERFCYTNNTKTTED